MPGLAEIGQLRKLIDEVFDYWKKNSCQIILRKVVGSQTFG